jgi:hypothetical protein
MSSQFLGRRTAVTGAAQGLLSRETPGSHLSSKELKMSNPATRGTGDNAFVVPDGNGVTLVEAVGEPVTQWYPRQNPSISLGRRPLTAAALREQEELRSLIEQGVCPRCRIRRFGYRWRFFRDNRSAIEVRCEHCGKFIKWAPQTTTNVDLADSTD